MNTCKNETCSNEPKGSSAYCSNTCKTIYNRNKSRNSTAVTPVTVAVTFTTVTGDIPVPGNRDRFTRPDGSQYQLDCLGKSFDITDKGNVYDTTKEVQACYV